MKKTLFLAILAVFNLLFYYSMRSFWSGIEGMFGIWWLAYLFLAILSFLAVLTVVMRIVRYRKPVMFWIVFGLSAALTVALGYMFYLGIGSLPYVLSTFTDALVFVAVVYFIWFLLFTYPKTELSRRKAFKIPLFILIFVLLMIQVLDLHLNYILTEPVVYAIEDEYQIVWTTNARATGVVTVGNQKYYDLYAGSERSETRVHKVAVPMAVLDAEKSYTISSTAVWYRGPYSGIKGRTVKRTYDFKPVDLSDGLRYYALSDAHDYAKAAIVAGGYWGEELDFLLLIGDICSHLESETNLNLINAIAHAITKGEKPVVFARGNHEVKAERADELYRYVGSRNEKFYYTFNLNGVYGIVLDLGEDHADDWWEFYDLAHFDLYRTEQTAFLQEILASGEFADSGIQYRMLISHMPVVYVQGDFLRDFKLEWTDLLNQFDLDIALSGHHHQLMPFTTDIPAGVDLRFHPDFHSDTTTIRGFRTDANFDTFIVSRRSDVQDEKIPENLFGKKLTGLAVMVDFDVGKQTARYTNNRRETVTVVNPFTGARFEKFEITLD
jgi:hypothetical protein